MLQLVHLSAVMLQLYGYSPLEAYWRAFYMVGQVCQFLKHLFPEILRILT